MSSSSLPSRVGRFVDLTLGISLGLNLLVGVLAWRFVGETMPLLVMTTLVAAALSLWLVWNRPDLRSGTIWVFSVTVAAVLAVVTAWLGADPSTLALSRAVVVAVVAAGLGLAMSVGGGYRRIVDGVRAITGHL